MWIVFRDPQTPFLHLDKYVVALVEDKDIRAYQADLCRRIGGRVYEFDSDVLYLQQFVTGQDETEYYARRVVPWVLS
jgi:hypothetical protein